MHFFPIFPFNCKFQLDVLALRAICSFFAQFCVRNWKFSGASRHLIDAMKIFYRCWQEKIGKKFAYFCLRRTKSCNFWPTYLPFVPYLRENGRMAMNFIPKVKLNGEARNFNFFCIACLVYKSGNTRFVEIQLLGIVTFATISLMTSEMDPENLRSISWR